MVAFETNLCRGSSLYSIPNRSGSPEIARRNPVDESAVSHKWESITCDHEKASATKQ
jgi:hypothetical protein